MEFKCIWNGREINPATDPEYRAHAAEIFRREVAPYLYKSRLEREETQNNGN